MVAMVVKVDGPGRAAMAETVPPAALAAAAVMPEQLAPVEMAEMQARAALVVMVAMVALVGCPPLTVLPGRTCPASL